MIKLFGRLVILIGLLVAVPILVVPFYPREVSYLPAFILPSLLAVAVGFALCAYKPTKEAEPVSEWQSPLQKGSLPVIVTWCFAIFVGGLPFVFGGQLEVIPAMFESVSGWTTTGLSVVNVAGTPRIFLFHRSFMQFCGGLGFVLMIMMMVRGKQSVHLYHAEGHTDRLMPSLKQTARTIFYMYSGFLAAGTLAYVVFGMSVFDALCHTMSALSTAGFSTKPGSIGDYNSVPIEIVTIILMLIGATNFAVLLLLVKRKFKQMFKVSEFRFMFVLILIFLPLTVCPLVIQAGMSPGEGIIEALFAIVTIFTTTGYATADYAAWPPFVVGLLILLMFVGGATGSTAGGIKLLRIYLLARIIKENIRKRLKPARQVTVPSFYKGQGEAPIDEATINETFVFATVYVAVFIAGALLITLTSGCSLYEAIYEFASALGTVGVSNGLTHAGTDSGTLIIEMIGMILGRLEIFIVFIGIYSGIRGIRKRFESRV